MNYYKLVLSAGHEIKALVSRVGPRWWSQMRDGPDSLAHFLRLLQDAMWWWSGHPDSESTFCQHADNFGVDVSVEERQQLVRVWNALAVLFGETLQENVISSYLHFWDPLRDDRTTRACHCLHHFRDHWLNTEAQLDAAFQLYLQLDVVARQHVPPLFTANHLLQRSAFTSGYTICWNCGDGHFADDVICIDGDITETLDKAIPNLQLLKSRDVADKSEGLVTLACEVFSRFDGLLVNLEPFDDVLPRVRDVLVPRHAERLSDQQGLFFLYGLALNRRTLRCENLAQFTVAYGRTCSIMSVATETALSSDEHMAFRHIAESLLYPLMLNRFFNSQGEVQTEIYCDLAHESKEFVNTTLARLGRVRQSLVASGEPIAISEVDKAMALFKGFAKEYEAIAYMSAGRLYGSDLIVDVNRILEEAIDEVRLSIGFSKEVQDTITATVKDHRDDVNANVPDLVSSMEQGNGLEQLEAVGGFCAGHVSIRAPETPCRVKVNRHALRLVLANLLRNAVKCHDWEGCLLGKNDGVLVELSTDDTAQGELSLAIQNDAALNDVEPRCKTQPPYPYDSWRRLREVNSRGSRLILLGLRYLRSDIPFEQSRGWLCVDSLKPFRVNLSLPDFLSSS